VFGRSWRIATIGGIPVNVDSSWIWIAVFLTYSLWLQFETIDSGHRPGATVAFAIFAAVLFFGSVFLHELAHAIAARAKGIRVFGITLVVFGGYTTAQSDEKGPGPSFLISAVGPGTSLALGAVFWRLSLLTAGRGDLLSTTFGYVGFVNLVMTGLNILPGLPLDGGRMLEAVAWRLTGDHQRATRIAAMSGLVVAGALVGVGVGIAFDLFRIGSLAQSAGLWLALIGALVFQGSRASVQQIGVRERLNSATAADAMEPPPPAVPADMTLSEALDRYLRGHEREGFPVVEGGRLIGMLSFHSAREVGMSDPLRRVRDAVVPLSQVLTAEAEEPLDQLAARLGAEGTALVLRDGQLVGIVSGSSLLRWAKSAR
jgi:Zn-dependent protease/predicted transcriptional regulator